VADSILLIEPNRLLANPENPRLIFHQNELDALQDSIRTQGVLVPLTIYQDGKSYVLLDGERRWRCALKLGLARIPAIVQPKPDRLQNIMLMFAIHGSRQQWDPLPTAYKLQTLESVFMERNGRNPSESELAELASMTRGEVRRYKRLLNLPTEFHAELMSELEKPRSLQTISVDHVLETTRGSAALLKRDVINEQQEVELNRAIIDKFRNGVVRNTVAPRQLARIARAVERDEVPLRVARRVAEKLIHDPSYTIDQAFSASVEKIDFEHNVEQLAARLRTSLEEHLERKYQPSEGLIRVLDAVAETIATVLDR
jgi:ParB family transcriptional regulator, chromosome partitioning protein